MDAGPSAQQHLPRRIRDGLVFRQQNLGVDRLAGMNGETVVGEIPAAPPTMDPSLRLAALFDAHSDRLYRLARRMTRTSDEARDLVQETFLKATGALGSFPHEIKNEEAWLVRVLVNIRRDQWRKVATQKTLEKEMNSAVSSEGQNSNQETALIAKTILWRALDTLHPRRRAVVVMHELEGMQIPAIAPLLGISVITARWHLSKGRRELLKLLKDESGR